MNTTIFRCSLFQRIKNHHFKTVVLKFSAIHVVALFICFNYSGFKAVAQEQELLSQLNELKQLVQDQAAELQQVKKELSDLKNQDVKIAKTKQKIKESIGAVKLEPSVDSKFDVDFYGFIKLDSIYNSGGTNNLLHARMAQDGLSKYHLSARQSRFGFKIGGPTDSDIKTSAIIETDFLGTNTALRLRRAFVKAKFTDTFAMQFGQDWNPGNLNYIPKTTNYIIFGGLGFPFNRRAGVRLIKDVVIDDINSITFEGGFAEAAGDGSVDFPTFQYNALYKTKLFGRNAKFALSGYWGQLGLAGETFNDNLTVLGGSIPLGSKVTFVGQVYTGEGLASVVSYGAPINYSLGESVSKTGGFAQLLLPLSDQVLFTVGSGFEDHEDDDLSYGDAEMNQTYFANLFYNVTKSLVFGFEYQKILTDYLDSEDYSLDRFQFTTIYSF